MARTEHRMSGSLIISMRTVKILILNGLEWATTIYTFQIVVYGLWLGILGYALG